MYKYIIMNIGKRIEQLRKAKGLSRSKLSFRCWISESHIRLIEQGKNENVTIKNLQKIADALEVKLTDLLEEPKAA